MTTLQPLENNRSVAKHQRNLSQDLFHTIDPSGPLSSDKKKLVNYSVKAQDYLVKNQFTSAKKSTVDPDDIAINIGKGGPLNNFLDDNIGGGEDSQDFVTPHLKKKNTLQLPQISTKRSLAPEEGGGLTTPMKGFLDVSQVSQKMRKSLATEGRRNNQTVKEISKILEGPVEGKQAFHQKFFGKQEKPSVKMSPKVLETWLNETLQDAEHLDIPGVIVKPEHKSPLIRYGIERQILIQAGIPSDMVDRVYRALFVYSVGFYELIKKCLEHTQKKYTIITALWKVFSILLEYCCRTDYRMLISEISLEHKREVEEMERKYQERFEEQANNEKKIKQTMEILQKYSETLEKERMNERQMRLKLEEEYTQNTKNHEEEVSLRLQFEAKLNTMHSDYRELHTKYVRTHKDMEEAHTQIKALQEELKEKVEENTSLNQQIVNERSRMNSNVEKIQSLTRELSIKQAQITELDSRLVKSQDDFDLIQYKLQDQQKDMTEMKLKTDVLTSTNDSLMNEKAHLLAELKETRELQRTYDQKCQELNKELTEMTSEFQELKRKMITFNETTRAQEEKLIKLDGDLKQKMKEHDELRDRLGTTNIQLEKVTDQFETSKKDLADTVKNLHQTTKARHDTEIKLFEEQEKVRGYIEALKLKEETLESRTEEAENLDKKLGDLQKSFDLLESKKQGIERQFEVTRKQLNEKISNLNDIIDGEKETREMWVDRYEKEAKEHNITKAQLIQNKTEYQDQLLATKNAEIKLSSSHRQVEILTEQNKKFQTSLNEFVSKAERLERELGTQKEIYRQFETSKKEYISRLKKELDTVEARWLKVINENNMVGEDFRSQAYINFQTCVALKLKSKLNQKTISQQKDNIAKKAAYIAELERDLKHANMIMEDRLAYILRAKEASEKVYWEMFEVKGVLKEKESQLANEKELNRQLEDEVRSLNETLQDTEQEKVDAEKMLKRAKAELQKHKDDALHREDREQQTDMDGTQLAKLEEETATLKEAAKQLEEKIQQLNSSTALGTNQASNLFDNQESGNLQRNASLNDSPGNKNSESKKDDASKVEDQYGSEVTSQMSPSLKSLMKSKGSTVDPNSALMGKGKKPKAAPNIKNLIRSAATRS